MNNIAMKIAIIGSGISGLSAAYLLSPHHDITVYERNAYIGGHSRTVNIDVQGQNVAVDTGFIVFNNWNYPNLLGLFHRLDVPYTESDMSFGVSVNNGWLEYSSNVLLSAKNIIRPRYLGMLRDILRFNRRALAYIERHPTVTLGDCLDELKMGEWFRHYYLLAMGAAIWSCPLQQILSFPAQTFIRFFKNHGLLNVNKRPTWYTVSGGSREYVKRLTASFKNTIQLNTPILSVTESDGKWHLETREGSEGVFDHVIFACHADEAIQMLASPSEAVCSTIGNFTYQENKVVVHSDLSFMPRNKKVWASWVYLSEQQADTRSEVSLSYWMNNLQPLDTNQPIIVTLNPERQPDASHVYDEHVFSHPVFDTPAIEAQARLDVIQGKNGLWFCGAYQRYGFHEDGLLSAVRVAEKMGVTIPWK